MEELLFVKVLPFGKKKKNTKHPVEEKELDKI